MPRRPAFAALRLCAGSLLRVIGLFPRFSNSLFRHWRSWQKKPTLKTTTDFITARNVEPHRDAIRCLCARPESFQTAS